jgi:putative tricarboxylic transport membrane protein
MTKRLAELLILSGYLILAVLLYRSTASYPVSVQGSTALYVRFLGMALGVFCCLEIFLWFKNRNQATTEKLTIATVPMRFWGLFILLLIYSTALSYLGFYLSSALFLPLAMLLLGAKKPLSIGLTSIGVLLFVYLVFAKLLEVPLPEGSLF